MSEYDELRKIFEDLNPEEPENLSFGALYFTISLRKN
jgi:hypothetical protein